MMKFLPALFVVGFICRRGGIDAFSFTSLRSRANGRLYDCFDDAQSMHQQPRTTKCILCMTGDQSSSTDDSISRRSALRQFGSFCLSTIASTQIQQQSAKASSFSDSPILNAVPPRQEVETGPLPPQFSDKNTVVASRTSLAVSSSTDSSPLMATTLSKPVAKPVKLETTQILSFSEEAGHHTLTIPTVKETRFTPSASTPSSSTPASSTTSKISLQSLKKGAMPELALATFLMGSIVYTVSGRALVDDTGSPKVKVVMVAPEPYGMDTGRRYWKGVDVTINDPVPPADIGEVCDAGVVTNECAASIAGFLGEVSNDQRGAEVNEEQVEKATAVANYLDSLSSKGINGHLAPACHGGSTSTATAFYSYLNELSAGNLPAPISAASVASYLDSVDVNGSNSLDGYQRAVRLSAIETKMNQLEERVDKLPTEIVDRMQNWQQGQDVRLSDEIRKISAFLIQDDQQQANGEGEPELVSKLTGGQTSNLPYL